MMKLLASRISKLGEVMKKTFIVMGVSRGGTSMVAGCMRILGINMGDDVDPFCQEDREFHGKSVMQICDLISDNNKVKDIWGWKYPHTHDFFFDIQSCLVNPHLIFVFRDLYAVAESFNKNDSIPLSIGIREAWQRYGKVISVAENVDCPKIFFSYEKAIRNKGKFLRDLSEFCGVGTSESTLSELEKFMSPGEYQRLL
jgi:hypothetical protein